MTATTLGPRPSPSPLTPPSAGRAPGNRAERLWKASPLT